MKHIYILLTSTSSKFGKTIRFITNAEYNHISISLDENFTKLYAFARKNYYIPLDAGFVRETLSRYSQKENEKISCKIYKIPLCEKKYQQVVNKINEIKNDDNYIYNLYSALLFPLIGGFPTYKSFTCVEFGAYILKYAGFELKKKPFNYTPQELGNELTPYLFYEGDLSKYKSFKYVKPTSDFFYEKPKLTKKLIISNKVLQENTHRISVNKKMKRAYSF